MSTANTTKKAGKTSAKKETAKALAAKATLQSMGTKAAKEPKYQYPAKAVSALEKKGFRRQARAANARFEKGLKSLRSKKNDPAAQKELKIMEKEYNTFQAKTYTK